MDKLVTTTLAIAEGTEVQHKSVMELVRKHLKDLEEYGEVKSITERVGTVGRPTEYALLNKNQTLLLLSCMRNSEAARNFKKKMVKELSTKTTTAESYTDHPPKESQMKELVKITRDEINGEVQQTVNARELHSFLGIGKDFSNWIKAQIDRARLLENRDFVTFAQKGVRKEGVRGATVSIEYHITLDAAKHVAMMSGSDKGFEVREYFIECERRLKEAPSRHLIPQTYGEALKLAYEQQVLIESQQSELQKARPKVEFYDTITDSQQATDMSDVAKALNMGIGRNRLYKLLRDTKIFTKDNRPYQAFVDLGYFKLDAYPWETKGGDIAVSYKTVVFPKGMEFLSRFLKKHGYTPQYTRGEPWYDEALGSLI